jgi:hypothetical protein
MTFDFENKCFLNNGKKYNIVFLEDIDCSDMKVIKERVHKPWRDGKYNHYRIIYYHEKENLYYKFWEKEYIHNASFTKVMLNNIFDNDLILPLKSLIFDKEHICRGYITNGGELSDKDICDLSKLFEKYKINIEKTNYIITDPVAKNIIKYNNNYTLIDYETMYNLNNLRFIKKKNKLIMIINEDYNIEIKNKDYKNYLINNYNI